MEPLLSVIIPVYNTKRFLNRCIESVICQKYSNMEVILIDDGSTDGSSELCDELAARHQNIRVLHKKNAGLGHARNSGIAIAQGSYVTFLDSDDYIDEDMYESMMNEICRKSADAAYCDLCFDKKDGSKVRDFSNIQPGEYSGTEMLMHIIGAEPEAKKDFDFDMSVCKVILKKSIIEENNLSFKSERELICEDLIFDIEYLPLAKKIVYLSEPYYHYCENEGSITHRYINNRWNMEKHLYQVVTSLLMKHYDNEEILLRYNRMFLGRVRVCIRQEIKYSKTASYKEIAKNIRQIVNDEFVKNIIDSYPFRRNPLKLRVFHYYLYKRNILGLWLLIKLK